MLDIGNFRKEKSYFSMEFVTDQEIWDHYFEQTYFSNLLQSWQYGEAKKEFSGWIVKRAIIKKNKYPVAICQWLEKSILKVLKIVRVNRGPIWLLDKPSTGDVLNLYAFLKQYFGIAKGKFLFIAPALVNNDENNVALKLSGYKKRNKLLSWKSALISLNKTEEELKEGLQSRLRNYIKRGERENYIFENFTTITDFDEMLTRYKQLQTKKNFCGIPAIFIESLHKYTQENALVTRLRNANGDLLAEKFLVIHGNQCTPLIAWTSEAGMKLHAMHLLLWKTILYLKKQGVSYFDVGGYNDTENASVSQFKKGFGGEEYCLIGEYRGFFNHFCKLGGMYERKNKDHFSLFD